MAALLCPLTAKMVPYAPQHPDTRPCEPYGKKNGRRAKRYESAGPGAEQHWTPRLLLYIPPGYAIPSAWRAATRPE